VSSYNLKPTTVSGLICFPSLYPGKFQITCQFLSDRPRKFSLRTFSIHHLIIYLLWSKLAPVVTFLTFVLDVSGANLGRDTDFTEFCDFSWVFLISSEKCQDSNFKSGQHRLIAYTFHFITH